MIIEAAIGFGIAFLFYAAGILTGIKAVHWVAEDGKIILTEAPQ